MESMSKWRARSTRGAGLVLLLLVFAAVPAAAQVPQDVTFSGRLVDGGGIPLVSPVSFDLWIYDDETLGTPLSGDALYAERHGPVTLDAQGNFSVLLGSGADCVACPGYPFPPFDAALFADVERYVEVVLVTGTVETLTPRVPIASVPWAFVAQQVANSLTHVRGLIAPNGFALDCACSATKTGTGQYLVTFDTPFADVPTPMVTSAAVVARTVGVGTVTTTTVEVVTFDSLGAPADSGFFLMVVGP